MAEYYSITKRDYEREKTNYRFAKKYYDKNKELLFMQNPVLNSALDSILKSLVRAMDECDSLIDSVDRLYRKYGEDSDFNEVVILSEGVIKKCITLIRDTFRDIYDDDPMSLQGILIQTNNCLGIISCNHDRVISEIQNLNN